MQSLANRIIPEGLTFDDVLLIPARSEVLPREVDITTHFSRDLKISAPIVSAAMDTVTESELAIAIAREGGIGVIHKNMPIEAQMEHVRKVKRSENGMIYDPVIIHKDANVMGNSLIRGKLNVNGITCRDTMDMKHNNIIDIDNVNINNAIIDTISTQTITSQSATTNHNLQFGLNQQLNLLIQTEFLVLSRMLHLIQQPYQQEH